MRTTALRKYQRRLNVPLGGAGGENVRGANVPLGGGSGIEGVGNARELKEPRGLCSSKDAGCGGPSKKGGNGRKPKFLVGMGGGLPEGTGNLKESGAPNGEEGEGKIGVPPSSGCEMLQLGGP